MATPKPYRYTSHLRPARVNCVQQIRNASGAEVELVSGTQTSYTIKTSEPLSSRVRAMFELNPLDDYSNHA